MKPITLALSYNDVLLLPQLSPIKSRNEVDLTTKIAPDVELKIPLVPANMDTVTGVEMAVAISKLGGVGLIGRFDAADIQADKVSQVTKQGGRAIGVIGVKDDVLKRAEILLKAGSVALHLDVAHAHATPVLKVIRECKKRFPKVSLIAGTVATYQGAYDLYEAGADSVKVGIGAGSICITRLAAGSGVPNITAIMEANRARKKFKNKYILADGGAATSGDVAKALAAGGDAYEGGNFFAGTDETPGEVIEVNGKMYKAYNGSTSIEEKKRQLQKDPNHKEATYVLHVEGVEGFVPYRGPVAQIIDSICAGVRSALSYSGARNLKEFHRKAQFIQITSAGIAESRSHDLIQLG